MSHGKVVGQLKGARGPIEIAWEIADFLSLSTEMDRFYESPTFFGWDASWYLRLYPSGEKGHSSERYFGLYLVRGDLGPPASVTYSFFLKKTSGKEEVVNEVHTFDEKDSGRGISKAVRRSELIEHSSEFLPSGVLTVICSLKGAETQAVREQKLSMDLKNLLISGDESDVTLKVQGEEFRLHRAIMAARTPVFGAMFRHDTKEKATGVVSVEDCEAGPFRAFADYLYTGSTDELSPEDVFGLYKIADKYQVEELKENCLDFLKSTLSVDTFSAFLDFALQYDQKDLIEQAADFLWENSSPILGREDWQDLMRNNVAQVNDLLARAFMKKDKTCKPVL